MFFLGMSHLHLRGWEHCHTHRRAHTPIHLPPTSPRTHDPRRGRELGCQSNYVKRKKKNQLWSLACLRRNDHFYRSLVHRGGFTHPVMVLVPDREAAWKKVGVSAEDWSEQKRVLARCRLALKRNGWLADPWLLLR